MLHGIIPHNHSDHWIGECKSIAHADDACIDHEDNSILTYYSVCSCDNEESVCHFTTNLFHQDHSICYFFTTSPAEERSIPLLTAALIPEIEHSIHGPPPVIAGYSFRAPPGAL